MSISSLCILLLFSVFLVPDVVEVEAYLRLYSKDRPNKASHRLKLHNTLIDGVASIESESALPSDSSDTETVGLLLTPQILPPPPSEQIPFQSGGPSSGVWRVLGIILSIIPLLGLLRYCGTCPHAPDPDPPPMANGRGDGSSVPTRQSAPPPMANVRGGSASGSVSSDSSAPLMANGSHEREVTDDGSPRANQSAPPVPPMVNGRGGGKSVHTFPPAPSPMENGRGDGSSVPTRPSAPPPMANVRGGSGFVPSDPSHPTMENGRRVGSSSMRSFSMEPRVQRDVENASSIELATRHNPTATRGADPGPSTMADFGLSVFTYQELQHATDNFSKDNFLGEGGFAKVYKGCISRNRKVAVKLLRNENPNGDTEFRNEVGIISLARHKNIVSLVGYCITDTKRLIVYEFVDNKSLADHLGEGGNNLQVMDWATRMKIAQGAAKGLVYLHEDFPQNQKIIHRDVKPANILLDSNFEAKVADFGNAKLCPDSFTSYLASYAIGTVGFIDPFYVETMELTFKSDVYSFGVVLLELISGETHLPRVKELKDYELSRALKTGNFLKIVDPKLGKNYDRNDMLLMVTCADACLRKDPMDRPQMKQIAQVLERVLSPKELKMRTRPKRGF